MMDKLTILAGFSGGMWLMYLLTMRSTPGKGWLKWTERLCGGIILCFLCSLALYPFGIRIAQSPLTAASAGFFGLPGAALGTFLALWP